MNNPLQLLGILKNAQSPQSLIENLMSNNQIMSNPMSKNAIQMAQKHDENGLYQLANNMCASQGKDFAKEFDAFKKRLGIR